MNFDKEVNAAANALCRWFGSQDIEPAMAISVMVAVTMRVLKEFPQTKEGGEAVIACIREMLENEK